MITDWQPSRCFCPAVHWRYFLFYYTKWNNTLAKHDDRATAWYAFSNKGVLATKTNTISESKNVKTGHETHRSTLAHRHWKCGNVRGNSANQLSIYHILQHLLVFQSAPLMEAHAHPFRSGHSSNYYNLLIIPLKWWPWEFLHNLNRGACARQQISFSSVQSPRQQGSQRYNER